MKFLGADFSSKTRRVTAFFAFFVFLAAGPSFAALTPDHFNGASGANCANWAVSQSGGSFATFTYTDTTSNFLPDDTSDSSVTNIGQLLAADSATTFIAMTYTDPSSGASDNFIYVDVLTQGIARNFDIIATDGSLSVTQSTNNIVASCGSTLLGATIANQWNLLFINLTGQGLGNITKLIIIPHGDGYDTPIYFDNVRSSNSSCSLPTPTPTNTWTNTPSPTPTNTSPFTPTPTRTNSPTNTFTVTPTNSATNTPTITPTFTPSPTPTNTVPNSPTNTPVATGTFTPTNTAPPPNTSTPTFTVTNSLTPTPTSTITN